MPATTLHAESSVVVLIDVQPSFLSGIFEADRVLARSEFVLRVAQLLSVPVLATEQYPSRMGGTHERLVPLFGHGAVGKMAFSCARSQPFLEALEATGRRQVVLVGIETHICVSQTAHDLLGKGFDVVVGADAVSARTLDRHKIGLKRIRDAGAVVAHTESMAYEWMESADSPAFRGVLGLVKEFSL